MSIKTRLEVLEQLLHPTQQVKVIIARWDDGRQVGRIRYGETNYHRTADETEDLFLERVTRDVTALNAGRRATVGVFAETSTDYQ